MVKITLDLTARGWLSVKLFNGLNEVEIYASYLSDGPRELISSARTILTGFPFATCRLQAEPGEHRLIFEQNGESVQLKVLEFASSFSTESNNQGKLIFEGTESAGSIARQIKRQFDRLLYNHGIDGYKSLWGHEFPKDQVTQLTETFTLYKSKKY